MKRVPIFIVAALILLSTLAVSPSSAATTAPIIVIHVRNQLGSWYDLVVIDIYQSPFTLVSNGTTHSGTFYSSPLTPNTNYTVQVYSQYDYASRQVQLGTTDVSLNFTLKTFVGGTPVRPHLIVSSVGSYPRSPSTGAPFLAILTISNIGSESAYEAIASLAPSGPLSISGSSGLVPLANLAAGKNVTMTVRMYSPLSTKSGSYSVGYTLSYYDSTGTPYNSTGNFNLLLAAEPNLKILSFRFLANPLVPGLDTFLNMGVINVGGDKAYDVRVSWAGSSPFLSNSTNYLGAVSAGSTQNSSFFVRIPSSVKPAGYNLTLNIYYKDAAGNLLLTSTQYLVSVVSSAPPSVSITNTLLDPPVLSPGTQGTFSIFFRNDGTTAADNIVVTINDTAGILTSHTFGLGDLLPTASQTSVVGVNVPATRAGVYYLTITAAYTDPAGVKYSSSIPVQIRIYPSVSLFSGFALEVLGGVVAAAVVAFLVYFFVIRKKQ